LSFCNATRDETIARKRGLRKNREEEEEREGERERVQGAD
jgi:hypothetical protein